MLPRPRSGGMPGIIKFVIPGMPKNIKKKIYYPVFLFFVYSVNESLAQGGTGGSSGGTGPITIKNPLGDDASFLGIINKVIDYLIYISVPILALMILVGGFQILTARDDAEKVKSGRNTIMWAVVGFLIVLVSKGVALILIGIIK